MSNMKHLSYPPEASAHLITEEIVRKSLPPFLPDSHKGQNGRLLLIASSPLFHGSGMLATRAAYEIESAFGMRTNDWLYYCSTPENIAFMKARYDSFIGITRDQVQEYLETSDVVVVGPGLMREPQHNFPETEDEPRVTKDLTHLVLTKDRKAVLDAGSLQVMTPSDLQGHTKVIITPHQGEMVRLFGVSLDQIQTSHQSTFSEITTIAELVQSYAKKHSITIVLKGPVDIIANSTEWYFSPGGDAGLTRGGTGDILAGITGALYTRIDDPLLAAACSSFVIKRAGEYLQKRDASIYSATDIVHHALKEVLKTILLSS